MDKHPDKYFSDKLRSYHKEPPSGAWDRIEANSGKAKPRFVWMKLAAAILLLIVSGFVFFKLNTKPVEVYVSQPKVNTSKNSTEQISHKPEIKEQLGVIETGSQHVVNNIKKIAPTPNVQKQKPVREEIIIEPALQYTDVVESDIQPTAEAPSNKLSVSNSDHSVPSRVITYSAQEVNNKYLRLKEKAAVVYKEPAKEKTSIGEIAVAIKNNHVGIGDLRQLKDDFLSLELFAQNDKTKTQ